MAGWKDEIEAEEQAPTVTTPAQAGRDVTTRRRRVELEHVDTYTGATNKGSDERRVHVGAASAITVTGTMQRDPAASGASWVNRTIRIRRVLGTAVVDFKTITPAAPSVEITAAELGGCTELSIGPIYGSGTPEATAGATARVVVEIQEGITPSDMTAVRRTAQVSGGASTAFGDR